MGDFAQEFLTRLDGKVSNEIMKMVLKELRMFTSEYDIQKKETSLVPYEPSIPDCYKVYLVAKKLKDCRMDR